MIDRIVAIAINTFREAVRDRILYGVMAFATLVLVFTLALAELSLGESRRVVLDVGLGSISLFSVVVAIFLGSSLLYREIESKTLYVILSKPVRRAEFLLGKYFGILLTALTFVALMGAVQLWVTSVQAEVAWTWLFAGPALVVALGALGLWKARDRTAALVPGALFAFGISATIAATSDVELSLLLAALALALGEVLLLTAVALLFSSFSTPFLTGALTLGVWLVGRSAGEMARVPEAALGPELRALLQTLAQIVPNFHLFVPGHHTLEAPRAWLYVTEALGYGALYAVALLACAAFIFDRRDLL